MAAAEVGVGVVGAGFGVGFADAVGVGVGLAVRLGFGDAATTRGDGTGAGALTTAALAGAVLAGGLRTAAAEAWEPEIAALEVAGDATCEVDSAADGWPLVQAASAAAQSAATTQRAGVGLVVRSRLAMDPG